MYPLEIKGLVLGEGRPKVCVPILGKTEEEIIVQAEMIKNTPADLVELRADSYEYVLDKDRLEMLLKKLKIVLNEIPLLFTFRTAAEGGERKITGKDYENLLTGVCQSGLCDIIDIEICLEGYPVSERVRRLVAMCHKHRIYVIASNHDFQKTPEKSEIIRRLSVMDEAGADILKIAVMPENQKDVLTLLEATEEMYNSGINKPLVTMSMGSLGLISRLSGEIFGSAMTFGSALKASAPGQMEAGQLTVILDSIHNQNTSL